MADQQARTIIAVTGEDERFAAVRSRAAALAAGAAATVVLYDIDAGGLFASPVPTNWSGEGQEALVADEAGPRERLDPHELEVAGRAAVARQVQDLRAAGIDAWGWLPTTRDAKDLAAYAERQGAAVVLVPPALEAPGPLDRAVGRDGVQDVREDTGVPFETVG